MIYFKLEHCLNYFMEVCRLELPLTFCQLKRAK
jgi:hypothetical protein